MNNNEIELSETEKQTIMRSLLEKKGSWVEWGKNCQKLHKAAVKESEIFEQTGFQTSQQTLIIVAFQVYESLVKEGATREILEYCHGPQSEVLYEFRILNQEKRLDGITLAQEKKLDADGAKIVAKAIQEFSFLSQPPSGFTFHPGDAVAYQYWKKARQKKSLPDRARLIAEGLKFAHSATARAQIEKLLTDFTVAPTDQAPLLPIYRLEAEEALPCVLPLAGTFPLTKEELRAVYPLTVEEPFRVVEARNNTKLVPLPGWQAILQAKDAVVILCPSDQLPKPISGKLELVLVVVDRAMKTWNKNSYFLVEKEEKLEFHWFPESPNCEILGQFILVLRPKKILDENNLTEPWQMDD
jgi:hypothetical protein